jgi:hypothetical protein
MLLTVRVVFPDALTPIEFVKITVEFMFAFVTPEVTVIELEILTDPPEIDEFVVELKVIEASWGIVVSMFIER